MQGTPDGKTEAVEAAVEAKDRVREPAGARSGTRYVDGPTLAPTTPPTRSGAGFRNGQFVRWGEYDTASGACYLRLLEPEARSLSADEARQFMKSLTEGPPEEPVPSNVVEVLSADDPSLARLAVEPQGSRRAVKSPNPDVENSVRRPQTEDVDDSVRRPQTEDVDDSVRRPQTEGVDNRVRRPQPEKGAQ